MKEILMPAALKDLSRCAIHTRTNKGWTLEQCIEEYRKIGAGGISVWRDVIEPMGARAAGRMIAEAGLGVASLVRGGFFVAGDEAGRRKAIDVNRVCIDEAKEIGAEMVVLVVGAMPGMALDAARGQAAEGIAAVMDHAAARGVKLAIEPLHPMYAADRSCINRMGEARRICREIGHPLLGIAVDVYHVWWDPDLRSEIEMAGKNGTLFGFHVCDWRVDTRRLLTDRGLMGEGCINIREIRGWMEAAGFEGFNEVEIFSDHYWAMDQREYLKLIGAAYLDHV